MDHLNTKKEIPAEEVLPITLPHKRKTAEEMSAIPVKRELRDGF